MLRPGIGRRKGRNLSKPRLARGRAKGRAPKTFLPSGLSLLEEAHRFGEKVSPRFDVSREMSAARHSPGRRSRS
ncbi:hypothetical protein F4V89_12765 [Neorhizobium galegae]|nr:hypothetical protein F4V89_12765 [Neorhizobium galegae]